MGAGYHKDSAKKLPIKPVKQRTVIIKEIILTDLTFVPRKKNKKAAPMNKPQAV